MINLRTGEFKLDEYNLTIHPELTQSAFRAGDIPFQQGYSNEAHGSIWFEFKGSLETLDAEFGILFVRGVFHILTVKFDGKYQLAPGDPIENWLTQVTGERPPFEYEWGCLISDVDEPGNDDFSVLTKSFLVVGKGFRDVQSFYKLRHSGERLRVVLFGRP